MPGESCCDRSVSQRAANSNSLVKQAVHEACPQILRGIKTVETGDRYFTGKLYCRFAGSSPVYHRVNVVEKLVLIGGGWAERLGLMIYFVCRNLVLFSVSWR